MDWKETNLAYTLKEHDMRLSSMEAYVLGIIKSWFEHIVENTESFALRVKNIGGKLKITSESICSLRDETHQKIAGVNFGTDDVVTKGTQDIEILRNKLNNNAS